MENYAKLNKQRCYLLEAFVEKSFLGAKSRQQLLLTLCERRKKFKEKRLQLFFNFYINFSSKASTLFQQQNPLIPENPFLFLRVSN